MTIPSADVARYIDLHLLQTIPFANLNRDDTNSVKTVQYGGVNRTRISSQSWKRAIRRDVEQALGEEALRTRRIAERLERYLVDERGWPRPVAARAGIHAVVASSVGAQPPKQKKGADEASGEDEVPWGTNAMVYVPASAIAELADIAEEHRSALETAKDVKELKSKDALMPRDRVDAVLRSRNGIINLLGRMLAELDDAKVDGAAQVAHIMTTHQTDVEIDYFSAVDDITAAWGDTAGSAHMGHAEYSAGTFYRYVTLDLRDLLRNLGGDRAAARRLASAFLTATVLSLPQAKKNSTAPHTVPDLIAVQVRRDRPYSYAAAFERPVRFGTDGGYTHASIATLDAYAGDLVTLLGSSREPLRQAYTGIGAKDLSNLGPRVDSIDHLVETALDAAFSVATEAEGQA